MALGDYPEGYNKNVHGPFDPARYYGKPDTPFGEVKVGELGSWLARRNKSPVAIGQAIGRGYWRWNHRYMLPMRSTPAPYYQFAAVAMLFFYSINTWKFEEHKRAKYH